MKVEKAFNTQILKLFWEFIFKKLNGLQKYQHFLFEASNFGTVKVQEVANGPFTEFNLLKTNPIKNFHTEIPYEL